MSCSKLDGQKPGINNSSDTISIILVKDAMDSILQINLGEEIVKVKLRSQTLESFPRNGHYGGYLFAADSINFYYGPSRSSSCRYIGKKK